MPRDASELAHRLAREAEAAPGLLRCGLALRLAQLVSLGHDDDRPPPGLLEIGDEPPLPFQW